MLFTLFFETEFFTNLATLTGYWVPGNPQSPCPPVLQLQTCVTWCGFFCECWGYKLRSHACTAGPFTHPAISPGSGQAHTIAGHSRDEQGELELSWPFFMPWPSIQCCCSLLAPELWPLECCL